MSCEAINNYLATESSRLGPWFYQKKMFGKSPWASLVKREAWPEGIGYDFRQITYERMAPASILSWGSANAFSASAESADCGACANSFAAIDAGYTTRTTTLYKYELKSRKFCVEDFKAAWEVGQQLQAVRDGLGNYVRQAWDQKDREDTFLATKHKVVADGTIDGNFTSTTASTYPAACATDILQMPLLQYWYSILLRDGAVDGALYGDGGQPVLPLVIGPESSQNLLRQDDAERNDIRYANPQLLQMGLGGSLTYRGFTHVIDPFPRRFQCVQGVYTEVAPFTTEAKTILTGGELNSAYLLAPYEEATIYNKELWTQMVPAPKSTGGAGTEFDPVSYTGEFVWKNFDAEDNVFRSMGRWYGRMFAAARIMKTELGVSIVFRRCDPNLAAIPTVCPYS
jgi:hypothetical protein